MTVACVIKSWLLIKKNADEQGRYPDAAIAAGSDRETRFEVSFLARVTFTHPPLPNIMR